MAFIEKSNISADSEWDDPLYDLDIARAGRPGSNCSFSSRAITDTVTMDTMLILCWVGRLYSCDEQHVCEHQEGLFTKKLCDDFFLFDYNR